MATQITAKSLQLLVHMLMESGALDETKIRKLIELLRETEPDTAEALKALATIGDTTAEILKFPEK